MLGRYSIEAELARGGMGVVHRALDRTTGRHVALKRLIASQASGVQITHLFHREYHTLRQLQHPRIIEVYDYGSDAEGPFYTMELLDGRDLRELAPLDFAAACRHLCDVASSLALLHARRLLHRDLSGRNVRLTSDGRAKLLDFGALAAFGVASQIVGTPPLVPPEAMHRQALDQRADLYALGGLAYHVLTGRHAYPAQALHALPELWRRGAPPPPSALVPGIPAALDELVLALLSLDPTDRPASAAEVIDRLNAIAGLPSEEALDVGASYLTAPRLVGRERVLERLHRACERILEGQARTVVIEGEPGAGKTRLLDDAVAAARLGGAIVLRVDAEAHNAPYGVARALVAALLAEAPELARALGTAHAGVLGQILPEVREAFSDVAVAQRSVDRNEQRVRVQLALASWLEAVSAHKPLVIALDAAHAADEPSLAVCAALARKSGARALGVLVTHRSDEASSAPLTWQALHQGSMHLVLARHTPEQTVLLVEALFGRADNAGRLGQWLHDRTDGNPGQCIALAGQLIRDGHVRYKDGAWVLPSSLASDGLPDGMAEVLARRVARLSEGARTLAEAVSILRGRFSIEQCLALTGADEELLFRWLAELVDQGILAGIDGDYQLAQRALQAYLRERVTPATARALHLRAGEHALARAGEDPSAESEAGFHLLRGGDELRGARILARVGGRQVTEIEGLARAAPGLEAALEVFERRGASKWMLLHVLEALTSAGWYVDRRYAVRYGERALTLALELTGLSLARKLAPFLGKRLGFAIGTTLAAIRHGMQRRSIDVARFRTFQAAFAPLIGNIAIMVGVAANSFDVKAARRYLDAARMMSAFAPDHIVAVMYDYARYYALASAGRIDEAESIGARVLAWFAQQDKIKILGPASDEAARAISGGQMLGLALFSALGGRPEALAWAERLERQGLSFYAMMAAQARFVYHVTRGELEQAAAHREQLELNAIAGGTTWQTALIIPMALGACHAVAGDAVRLRQAAEDLEHSAREVPTMLPIARMFRATYELWRDRPKAALSELDALTNDEMRPHEHLMWSFAHGLLARAMTAADRAGDALKRMRELSGALGSCAERGIFMLEPTIAHALAEAAHGDATAAAARLERAIADFEPHGVPLAMALLHEARARVARRTGDAPSVALHVTRFEHWAKRTECTALVARAKRTAAIDARDAQIGAAQGASADLTLQAHASAVRTMMEQHEGEARARAALRWIIESSGAASGYLLLGTGAALRIVAQFPEDLPPSDEVLEHVQRRVRAGESERAFLDNADAPTVVTTAEPQSAPGEAASIGALTVQELLIAEAEVEIVGAVALHLDLERGAPLRRELLSAIASSLRDTPLSA